MYHIRKCLSSCIILLVLFFSLQTQPVFAARVRYAKPSPTGTGDCSSWANACRLQTALSGAVAGDEIWVMQGTHKPTTGTDRSATFQLKSGVAIFGGFVGLETIKAQRDFLANVTILSGDLSGNDGPNFTNNGENTFNVVTSNGADATSILDGFTISGGNDNNGAPNEQHGGGLVNNSGSPTLINVIFNTNSAHQGGGMYIEVGNPTLTNLTFTSNHANSGGGGIFNNSGTPKLSNVSFNNNDAPHGGGVYNLKNIEMNKITFSGNQATNGGGFYNNGIGAKPDLTNVTFTANSANAGGAIYNSEGSPSLTNVTIALNSGGGMYNVTCVHCGPINPQIRNSIFWGNTGYQIVHYGGISPAVSDSVVQGGYTGGDNITTADPKLGNLTDYGGPGRQVLPILSGSSALNKGNASYCSSIDQRGKSRPQGPQCDIGAYEYKYDNDAPLANPQYINTNEDTSKAITLTGSDVDLDPLRYSIITHPGHGLLSGTAPDLTYTPNSNFNGSDSFTFRVNDGTTNSTTATVNIIVNPVNDAPVAAAQSVTTDEDTPKAITLTGSDIDGNTLTYTVVSNPSHGSLSGTAPNLAYAPSPDYNGSDSFTFRVNDGTVNSAAATVSITINPVNDPPVLATNNGLTAKKGWGNPIHRQNLLATDVDGDVPVYSLVTVPMHGILQLNGVDLIGGDGFTQQDINNNLLVYLHDDGEFTQDSFSFTLQDLNIETSFNITITAGNIPPTAVDDTDFETLEDHGLAISISDLLANDYDLETEASALTVSSVGTAVHGTTSRAGDTVVYTPSANYHGIDSFVYTITDGEDTATASVFISVAPVNDTPTNIQLSPVSLHENNLPNSEIGTFTSSDVDTGESFTYALVTGTGDSGNSFFSISGDKLYSKISFDYEHQSNYQIRVRTTDSFGATFDKTLTIHILNINEDPTNILLDNNSVDENAINRRVGGFVGSDPEGDPIAFTLVSGSGGEDNTYFFISGDSLYSRTGLDYEEKTTRSIRVQASDGKGGTFATVFSVAINNLPIPPDTLPAGATNCGAKQDDLLTLFSSNTSNVKIQLTANPILNSPDPGHVCDLSGNMLVSVPGNQSISAAFSGWVNNKNHIVSEQVGEMSFNLAGLTLHAKNVSIEYYLESPRLRLNNPELKIPDTWGGLGSTIPNPTIIDLGGIRMGTPDIPDFLLPTIKSPSGFEVSLNGKLEPVPGGYEITGTGSFTIPNIGKKSSPSKTSQECSIGVGVTLYSGSPGTINMTLTPISAAATDNILALRGMEVSLDCYPGIAIGTTGFALTGVRGSVVLTPSNESVSLGITISSMRQLQGIPIISVDGDTTINPNPFELQLSVELKVLIFEMAKASANIKANSFTATLRIDIAVATGDVTVNAWSAQNKFHFTGSGVVTIGVPKNRWGEACLWYPCSVDVCQGLFGIEYPCGVKSCYACTGLPPVSLELASASCQFGEFTNGAFGMKGFVTYAGISYGYYIDDKGNLEFGNVDQYQPVQNPYSLPNLLQEGYSPALASSLSSLIQVTDQIPELTNESEKVFNLDAVSDVSFVVISRDPLDLQLFYLDGGVPTPPEDHANQIQPEQVGHYELEHSTDCGPGQTCPDREGSARIRFVSTSQNLYQDQAKVSVTIDDSTAYDQVAIMDIVSKDYISVGPGDHTIIIDSASLPQPLTIQWTAEPDTDYTITVLGMILPFASVLEDSNSMPDELGTAKVRVVYGSNSSADIDMFIGDTQAEVCSPGSSSTPLKCSYLTLPAGDPTISIRQAGTQNDLAAPKPIHLVEGMVYTIYVADVDNQGGTYSLDWMQTLDESYTRVYHTTINVDQAEPGYWQLLIPAPEESFDASLIHSGKPPVLDNLTVAPNNNSGLSIDWELTPGSSSTLLTIYANQGPTTRDMETTSADGTTQTVTLPNFDGVPVYQNRVEFSQSVDSVPYSVDLSELDLSKIASGNYYLWITADDGFNPPISGYFVSPQNAAESTVDVTREGYDPLLQLRNATMIEVDHSTDFPDSWIAAITPIIDPDKNEILLNWELLNHPDVDAYTVIVNSDDLGERTIEATSIMDATYDDPDNPTFHTTGYAKIESIQPNQTYTVQVEARDDDSGKTVLSQTIQIEVPTGDFKLETPAERIKVEAGDQITVPIHLNVTDDLYYPFVNLGIDIENTTTYGIRAHFTNDYLGSTTLTQEKNEILLEISIPEDAPHKNQDILIHGYNGAVTKTLVITLVMNTPPQANDDTVITDEDTEVAINVLANDIDVDADPLTVLLVDDPLHGSLTSNPDNSLTYTPEANYNGTDAFTYKVSDGTYESNTANVFITISPVNDAPTVQNDTYLVNEDTVLEVAPPGILENDSDVEGDPLTAELISGTSNGSLTLRENGSFSYAPVENWNGVDNFTYTACDPSHACGSAVVTITVQNVNDPPVASNDSAVTNEDTEATIDVAANDIDIDGNLNPGSSMILNIPTNGSLINNKDGTFTYIPNKNFFGEDQFTYSICDTGQDGDASTESDNLCDSAEVSIKILPINDPPEVTINPADQMVQFSDSIIPIAISVLDVDSSEITIYMPLPGWLSLSGGCHANGIGAICEWILEGVPNVAANDFYFPLTISDEDGGQTSASIHIQVIAEDSFGIFHAGNPAAVRVLKGSDVSEAFDLEIRIWETYPDQSLEGAAPYYGDINFAQVSMDLNPIGSGSKVTGLCRKVGVFGTGSKYHSFQRVICSFDNVPVNTYFAKAQINGGYYTGSNQTVLVVYDPSHGHSNGKGSFYWPDTADPNAGYSGDITDFEYSLEYNKGSTNLKGSLLLVRHLKDGSVMKIKSNGLYGMSLGIGSENSDTFNWAIFSGSATYSGHPGGAGNHEFLVYVEDNNMPGNDRFWIEVKDKDGNVETVISIPREPMDNAVELIEGSISISQ